MAWRSGRATWAGSAPSGPLSCPAPAPPLLPAVPAPPVPVAAPHVTPIGVRERSVAPLKMTSRSALLAQTICVDRALPPLPPLPPAPPLVPPVVATPGRSFSPTVVLPPVVTVPPVPVPPALVTWSVAVPTISPDVALTVKVPVAVGVQAPLLPQPAFVLLADQVGVIETSLLSVSKPVAVNL